MGRAPLNPIRCSPIVKQVICRTLVFFFSALAVIVIGCGGSRTSSSVSGVVKYKGSPVSGGELILVQEGNSASAFVTEQGSFTITDIPPGEYAVYFDNELLNPKHKQTQYNPTNMNKGSMPSMGTKGGMAPPGMPAGMTGPGMGPAAAPGSGAGFKKDGKSDSSTPEGMKTTLGGTYVELPKGYLRASGKSTHKITVAAGKSTQDIELKD